MEVELFLESAQLAQSIRNFRFSWTISVVDQLHKLFNVNFKSRIILIAEHLEEQLLSSASLQHISEDGQKGPEVLANFLRSELLECRVVTG